MDALIAALATGAILFVLLAFLLGIALGWAVRGSDDEGRNDGLRLW